MGVSFKEYDVGVDQEAAMRMVRLSRQQGVPVITVDNDVVIGFDRRRLEQLLSQAAVPGIHLGAAVADARTRSDVDGAFVGRVNTGSTAANAGLQPGDVIVALGGRSIRNARDLESITATLTPGARIPLAYTRAGQRIEVELRI
jgi:S1-C subfamily serine protease